jgi:anti-sigma factor RsiW
MAGCSEIRELLDEYRRGDLPPGEAQLVEAHLAGCDACRRLLEADRALVTLLAGLPRPAAPAGLARQIRAGGRRPGPRGWLNRPWAAALAGALVMAGALTPWVRFREPPVDVVAEIVRSGVAEHRRILLQLETTPAEVTDPSPLFERVRSVTHIPLPPALAGVGELRLLTARPTVLAERTAAAATLRYPTSPLTTYFVLLGKDLPMPAERRVQIDQYRPHMRQVSEYHVIYWKQGDLAYLMVSGLDDAHTRQLFLKMRKAF